MHSRIACPVSPVYSRPMTGSKPPVASSYPPLRVRQQVAVAWSFPVHFTRRVLSPENPVLRDVLSEGGSGPHRVLACLDAGLTAAWPELAERFQTWATAQAGLVDLVAPPLVLPGGERAKADSQVLDAVLRAVFDHGLCRQSFILACGGGAFLDAVGFGAATAHRGVRLIRLPSTVLAQNDAGVGLKNGINRFGRKNFWGCFAPPFAVINDFDLLERLPQRELRAGLAEAVKVACIRNRDFFQSLWEARAALARLEPTAVERLVMDCAVAHLSHIAGCGDPFELGSARPLDFGHWSAHALEEASGGALRHGEAVAVGVALDSIYSCRSGRLPAAELELILELLATLGLPLWSPLLADLDLGAAVESFREHLGGRLHITLLQALGQGVEVHSLDLELMARAREELRLRAASLRERPGFYRAEAG